MSKPFDGHHVAPTLYDKKGRPFCEAPFTPKSDTKRYICIVPPEKVIPVIFVPGIMGSNLRLLSPPQGLPSFGDIAWRPDDTYKFLAKKFLRRSASEDW